jgi:restriction endonuclease S subunit
MYGAGGQKRVPDEFLKDLIVPVPDSHEQREIGIWLEKKNNDIELATIKIQESINNLRDYRASVITNAVTGQIDVRKN